MLEVGLLRILDELVEDEPVDVVVVAQAGERVGRHLTQGRPVLANFMKRLRAQFVLCLAKW